MRTVVSGADPVAPIIALMHPAPGPDANPRPAATPPGWYPDPSGAPQQRYWDGVSWSGHAVAPHHAAASAPANRSWIPWTIAAVAVVLALIALLFALINRPGRQGKPGQPGHTSRPAAMAIVSGDGAPSPGRLF